MRRVPIVLCVATLLLAGCGDDDDEATTGAETVTAETTAEGEGPQGELTERAIGSAEVGTSSAEVADAFGAPDTEQEQPGCELAGPNATPVLKWTWNLEDGSASIDFDAAGEGLISYRTNSSALPTANGVRIGDSFQVLSDSYGPTLKPLNLGADSTERAGLWYVGKPAKEWLLFSIAGGKVTTIQGGDIQICE